MCFVMWVKGEQDVRKIMTEDKPANPADCRMEIRSLSELLSLLLCIITVCGRAVDDMIC